MDFCSLLTTRSIRITLLGIVYNITVRYAMTIQREYLHQLFEYPAVSTDIIRVVRRIVRGIVHQRTNVENTYTKIQERERQRRGVVDGRLAGVYTDTADRVRSQSVIFDSRRSQTNIGPTKQYNISNPYGRYESGTRH